MWYVKCKQETDDGEVVEIVDEFVAKMSDGDVDVEPFLVSRNTLGNDEPQLKFSKENVSGLVAVKWW